MIRYRIAFVFFLTMLSQSIFAQTIIFHEDFEGAFPNSLWASITDLNSNNGLDYWDDTSAQANNAYGGSWSGWSADIGSQIVWTNVFTDPFGTFSFTPLVGDWIANDAEPTLSGADYWGSSNYWSTRTAYSAENSNVAGQYYDNNMKAWMFRRNPFNANSWSYAKLKYWLWSSTASNDFVVPAYTDAFNSGNPPFTFYWQNAWRHFGNTGGLFQYYEVEIPTSYLTNDFNVGFYFYSNGAGTDVGSYVDDVTLEWGYSQGNSAVGPNGEYDDYMNAEMRSTAINLANYGSPTLEYYVKTDTESIYDHYITEISTDGSNWNTLFSVSGNYLSNNWIYKSHSLSAYAGQTIYLRFRFTSDYLYHGYPGSYIDDIIVSGTLQLPNGQPCTSPFQCSSNSCGGAHTDIFVHCNTDQSSTAYGDRLNYVNSCGGAGVYSSTNSDYYSDYCPTNKVCDTDLAYTAGSTSTFIPGPICKNDLYVSCNFNSECWNDNGGVNCRGSTNNKLCSYGTVGNYCTNNDDLQCISNRCDDDSTSPSLYSCQSQLSSGSQCNENSDCSNNNCNYGVCGGSDPSYSLLDTWAYDGSTTSDGIAFTDYEIRPSSFGHTSSIDMICYDFNEDLSIDSCYYDNTGCSGCSANSCNLWSGVISSAGFSNFMNAPRYGCDIDDGDGCVIGVDAPSMICSNCPINTATPTHKSVTGLTMYDCDDSSYLSNIEVLPISSEYSLINPKFAYCQNNITYIYGGNDGELFTASLFIPFGTSQNCAPTQICSHSLEYISSATQAIPSPCRTLNGYSCTQNQTCASGLCVNALCNPSFDIDGRFVDQNGMPMTYQQLSLINCASNITTQSALTGTNGTFYLIEVPGNYSYRLNNTYGTFWFAFNNSYCYDMTEGSYTFNDITFSTTMFLDGTLVDKQTQQAAPNHDVQLQSCLDQLNNQSVSDTQGYFAMTGEIGLHKLKVNVQGYNFSVVEASSGNDCTYFFDNEHLGVIEIPENLSCGGWDNTCYNENSRLFNCHFNYNQTNPSCLCYYEQCSFGCTGGANTCNGVGTGTLRAAVAQPNGIPVKGANISVNNLAAGHTNSLGKKEINLDYGYHNISSYCPGGIPCQSSTVLLNRSSVALVQQCSCGIVGPQGNLTVFVKNNDSRPVVNAYVYVDGNYEEYEGFTNPLGTVRVTNLSYGQHSISIVYRFANETTSATYRKTVQVLINQPDLNVSLLALTPNNPGFSSYGAEYVSDQIAPLLVFLAPALDVVSISMSTNDFCGCLLGSGSPDLGTCITNIATCMIDTQNCPPSVAHLVSKAKTDCWLEAAMFGLDVGSPFIPTGIITHFAVLPFKKAWMKVAKTGIAEFLGKSGDDLWDFTKDVQNHVAKWTGNSFAISKKIGLIPDSLTDDGLRAVDDVFERATSQSGLKISPKITSRMFRKFTDVLGEQYSKRIFDGLGSLKGRNIPGVNSFEDNLIKSTKTFDDKLSNVQKLMKKNLKPQEVQNLMNSPTPSHLPQNTQDAINELKSSFGAMKGRAFEIEAGSHSDFFNNLNKVDVDVYSNGKKVTDLDLLLNNHKAVSVKQNRFKLAPVMDSYRKYEHARTLPTNIPTSPNYFDDFSFVFKGGEPSQPIKDFLKLKKIGWTWIP